VGALHTLGPKCGRIYDRISMKDSTFVLCAQTLAIGAIDIPMITIQSTDMGCTLSAH
jgi:hypothetical protein